MGDDDWRKPQIGVASSWNEITPCNVSIRRLTEAAKEGVRAAGGVGLEFGTITVSDGISMGHEGMRASLVSREVFGNQTEGPGLEEVPPEPEPLEIEFPVQGKVSEATTEGR